jgi:thioredoxin reductase (NADPH)
MEKRELVIIGSGPAGLTAAIYAKRAGLDVLLLEKGVVGGQVNITDKIENWPGTISIGGMELAQSFKKHAETLKVEIRDCSVVGIDVQNGKKRILTDKEAIEAEALILATGSNFRKLGCKGERDFTGAGVSYCAVCDGAFFEGADIAVVGGGNAAVEEAAYLTRFAAKVYLIHRRNEFRADHVAVEEALANSKIVPVMDTTVESIEGEGLVNRITIRNVKSGNVSALNVSGVFIFVGTQPNVSYLGTAGSVVKQTPAGWIITNEHMETSADGIFAAGDVREKTLRQVVTAAGDGAEAAMAAYQYISGKIRLRRQLFEPVHAIGFFSSSIDKDEISIRTAVESYYTDKDIKLVFVDTYRDKNFTAEMGLDTLPAVVEMSNGNIARTAQIRSLEDVKRFVKDNKTK